MTGALTEQGRGDPTTAPGGRGAIITVASHKGGVGKSTLAYELAAVLDAVLIDLDFHGGSSTDIWGFDPRSAKRAPLLDALERGPAGRAPRPKQRPNRPSLVPCHPDLAEARLDSDDVADCLESWAASYGRPLAIDTHPGAHATTDGALRVSDLVVTPVPPGRRAITSTETMLTELQEYPVLLVPVMAPATPPRWWIDALRSFTQAENVHLAPPVSQHGWINGRLLTTAITLQRNPGQRTQQAANEYRAVATRSAELCQTKTA